MPSRTRSSAAVPAPGEVLRQVRRLDLRTRRLVNSRFSGEYHSVFKGQGIEFAEVREYQPGDDVRSIDWNVTARLGHPYIKRYVEERELTVVLVVDLSGSQRLGSRGRFKSDLLVEVATVLAMSAMRNNDRIGLLLVTDRVEWFVPPRKGKRHVLRLIRDLLAFEPAGAGTDLPAGLEYANRILSTRSVVFLFSDFQLGGGDWDRFRQVLRGTAARHDVIAVRLGDPLDAELPSVGLLALRDPESGEEVVVDTSSAGARARYAALVAEEAELTRRTLRSAGVDEISLSTDVPYTTSLLSFFRRRELRRRR